MQLTPFVAVMQVLRFYCSYAGGTFCYSYVGGSFCCNHAGDCFCCNYAVRSFCSTYAGDSLCSKYVGDNFYCNYAGESLCWKLCRSYFLQCIICMTVFIVILQGTHSVVLAMEVVVSSSNFIFLSLTDTRFSKIDLKTFEGIILGLHFTTFVNILPKLRHVESRYYIQIG